MSPRLRAFLVDDEVLSLKRLARLLQDSGRVDIVGCASDPETAVGPLTAEPLDVVFLDIHMPGLTGFQLLERLPEGPMVVFTTAYDQHAVRAFEVNAVDYLLKPIARPRLERSLDRLERARDDPARSDLRAALRQVVESLRPPSFLERLPSRLGERVQLFAVDEVTHVVAKDRATYAVTASGSHVLDATIAELERRLDPAKFLRIHRGALVNLTYVRELRADIGGRLLVRLTDRAGTELVVARDRVRPLKDRLGL